MSRSKAREVIVTADNPMDAFWSLLGAEEAFQGFRKVLEIYLYEELSNQDLTDYVWIVKGESNA